MNKQSTQRRQSQDPVLLLAARQAGIELTETGHQVGKTYFSLYWQEPYTVEAAHENGDVTVLWHRRNERTRHCTHIACNSGNRKDVEILPVDRPRYGL